MILFLIIQAFHDNIQKFWMIVLAKFSIFNILNKLVRADETLLGQLVRIFDYVGAFVAYFATLRDAMNEVRVSLARQFYFVGETFMEVVGAQRWIFHVMPLHI